MSNHPNVCKLQLPAQRVDKVLNDLVTDDLASFADLIETARVAWRRFPQFVEAAEFPPQLREMYVEVYGCEPSDECGLAGEEALDPSYRERLRSKAEFYVRCHIAQEQAKATEQTKRNQHSLESGPPKAGKPTRNLFLLRSRSNSRAR